MVQFQQGDFGEDSKEHGHSSARTCPHCKKEIGTDLTVCPFCNKPLEDVIQVDLFPEFRYQRLRRIFQPRNIITAVLTVAVFLGLYGYFTFQQFSGDYHLANGDRYIAEGNASAALESYQRAVLFSPQNPVGYEKLAWAEYQLAHDAEALSHFEKALQLEPNRLSSLYGAGLSAYYLRNYEDAISFLTRVIELAPGKVGAYEYLGLAEYRLGNYENAFVYFDKAWIYNSQNATVIYYLAKIFMDQGDTDLAIEAFNTAENLGFDFVSMTYGRGLAQMRLGNFEEANSDFERALALAPTRVDVHFALAKSLYLLEDFNASQSQLINIGTNLPQGFQNDYFELSGWLSLRQGNQTSALEAFNRWLNLDPNNAQAFNALGWAAYYAGDCKTAQFNFQNAMQASNGEWNYVIDSFAAENESPQAGLSMPCSDN